MLLDGDEARRRRADCFSGPAARLALPQRPPTLPRRASPSPAMAASASQYKERQFLAVIGDEVPIAFALRLVAAA